MLYCRLPPAPDSTPARLTLSGMLPHAVMAWHRRRGLLPRTGHHGTSGMGPLETCSGRIGGYSTGPSASGTSIGRDSDSRPQHLSCIIWRAA